MFTLIAALSFASITAQDTTQSTPAAPAAGERRITAVAVYTPTKALTRPCGACRQVIHEFGPKATIISVGQSRARIETTLDALLPGAFGPKDLLKKR